MKSNKLYQNKLMSTENRKGTLPRFHSQVVMVPIYEYKHTIDVARFFQRCMQ